jgi:hypothetical protein
MKKCPIKNCKGFRSHKPFCLKCWLNVSIYIRRAISLTDKEDDNLKELVEIAKNQIYSTIEGHGKQTMLF